MKKQKENIEYQKRNVEVLKAKERHEFPPDKRNRERVKGMNWHEKRDKGLEVKGKKQEIKICTIVHIG